MIGGNLLKYTKLLAGSKRMVATLPGVAWYDSMSAGKTSVLYFQIHVELVHVHHGM